MAEVNKDELMEIMFKVFRLMRGEMSYTDNITHLSILQIQTLFFLNHGRKNTMSDIAQYFHIELPSATSLLDKLCDHGLVERQIDPLDRRLVRITLTVKGKTLLKQAMGARRKKMEKLLSYLSKKEKFELMNILKTLYNKLQS